MSLNSDNLYNVQSKTGQPVIIVDGIAFPVGPVYNIGESTTDLSFITATSNDILQGKIGVDADGNQIEGAIETVTASLSDNMVTIPAGYVASEQTLTVAEAGDVSVSSNVVTIPVGYIASERTATVGTAKGATTYTPTTADQTIAADTYLSGEQTIKGDANLVAENIAEGVEIFGIAGSHSGGGGSMDFYKCAAVHNTEGASQEVIIISGCPTDDVNGTYLPTEFTTTDEIGGLHVVYKHETANYYYYSGTFDARPTWIIGTDYTSSILYVWNAVYSYFTSLELIDGVNVSLPVDGMTKSETTITIEASKTWDGYKAVLNNGVYSFEESVIEGLSYTDIIPEVNRIYSADALVAVFRLHESGDPTLVFHAPLTAKSPVAVTGQEMASIGEIEYTSVGGVDCAKFSITSKHIITDVSRFPKLTQPITIAGFFNFDSVQGDAEPLLGYGPELAITSYDGALRCFYAEGSNYVEHSGVVEGEWYHTAVTFDGTSIKMYINGVLSQNKQATAQPTDVSTLQIGGSFRIERGMGYVSDVRIYNRALSADEIKALYDKFTGSASGTPVFKVTGDETNPEVNGDYYEVTPDNAYSCWDTTKKIYSNGTIYFAFTAQWWNGWTVVNDISTSPCVDEISIALAYCMGYGNPPEHPWDVSNWHGNAFEITKY